MQDMEEILKDPLIKLSLRLSQLCLEGVLSKEQYGELAGYTIDIDKEIKQLKSEIEK